MTGFFISSGTAITLTFIVGDLGTDHIEDGWEKLGGSLASHTSIGLKQGLGEYIKISTVSLFLYWLTLALFEKRTSLFKKNDHFHLLLSFLFFSIFVLYYVDSDSHFLTDRFSSLEICKFFGASHLKEEYMNTECRVFLQTNLIWIGYIIPTTLLTVSAVQKIRQSKSEPLSK